MRHRLRLYWWPLLVVALASGCEDDKPPSGTGGTGGTGGSGGSGGTTMQDSGPDTSGGGTGGSDQTDGGTTDTTPPPPGDGGLVPCLERPTDLDRPPSGQLPCDLLPPGFMAP